MVRGPMIAAVTAGCVATNASANWIAKDAGVGIAREQLTGAIEEFRHAGISQRVIREDVPSFDILMSLAGVTLVAGAVHQRVQAERLLDLLMDGVTRSDGWRRA